MYIYIYVYMYIYICTYIYILNQYQSTSFIGESMELDHGDQPENRRIVVVAWSQTWDRMKL